ncbi:MAG: adenosylcobinamide amidohydrolase [Halobellus sp.]|uniref:adenosylcobinamide amidohydrolase n=1 Tax=Halobellus sp. TaxID=1979212 RepID=UPI0035D4FA5D
MFDATVTEEVCRLRRPGTRWLSTGYDGGESHADAGYLCSVPEGWDDVDIANYIERRRLDAGFDDADPGPALLTGISMCHAHRARLGSVEAVATAGLSNPAALPVPGERWVGDEGGDGSVGSSDDSQHVGTVNVVVGTTRSLAPGALANLVAVAAEAKTATLLTQTGFPGTTSDAVVVACDPAGDSAAFSGSATAVGAAARACVRDALLAALRSRYGTDRPPTSVAEATYGVVTDARAAVSTIDSDNSDG